MSSRAEPFWGWPGWKHLRFAWFTSLICTIWFLIIFGYGDHLTQARSFRIRVHFDWELNIPFIPETVIAYMSIYLLFFAAPFILRDRNHFTALARTLIWIILIAGICFVLIPAELAFPTPTKLGRFPKLFFFADQLNLTYNLVPSLHVALSVVCIAAFTARTNRVWRTALWSWGIAIAASTLLTHQHHLLDVISGIVLALLAHKFIYIPNAHCDSKTSSVSPPPLDKQEIGEVRSRD